jgi:hypothetical protein
VRAFVVDLHDVLLGFSRPYTSGKIFDATKGEPARVNPG